MELAVYKPTIFDVDFKLGTTGLEASGLNVCKFNWDLRAMAENFSLNDNFIYFIFLTFFLKLLLASRRAYCTEVLQYFLVLSNYKEDANITIQVWENS